MTDTFTKEHAAKLEAYLATHTLPKGLGSEENACSIAAINLAISGRLTDDIPACMSKAIGRWIISVQDSMPGDMRNSAEWKQLLPLAAGTGRALEKQRAAVALDWMWTGVLPQLQPIADERGYGDEWRRMTTEKTREASVVAKKAADAAARADAAAYADAAADADAAAYAAAAAATATAADSDAYAAARADAAAYAAARADAAARAYAAAYAAAAADSAADAAAYAAADAAAYTATAAAAYADAAAYAAAYAAAAADSDAYAAAARAKFWAAVDPCACLRRMIEVSE